MTHSRWLITGGCGFIGTALVRRLLAENPGVRIRVLDNLSVGNLGYLAAACDYTVQTREQLGDDSEPPVGVTFFQGDIRNPEDAEAAARGVDVIVHLAANSGVPYSIEHPRFDMESNVLGAFNMLEAARLNGVGHFVLASSSAVAGAASPPMHEKMIPRPMSPYGASKLAGEGYCSTYFHSYGVKTVSLRFGNVYGPCPSHKTSVVSKFIHRALEGLPCEIYGDGKQTRDFIFIEDIVGAVVAAAHYDQGGEVFQIATSKERTVGEMAELLAEALGRYGVKVAIEYKEPRRGDVVRNYSDTTKANTLLGWKASMELEPGLAVTAEHFCGGAGKNSRS
ncbi:MAG: NAD-dependent epimerase/dehydratase family protein [Desulfovibrio sp.]